MIYAAINDLQQYKEMHQGFDKAFDFLMNNDLDSLQIGKHLIDGDNVFALVQEYETKDSAGAKFEVHRKYIDLQYVVYGIEKMGHAIIDHTKDVVSYDNENDFALLDCKGSFITVKSKEFCIFYPNDAHMPGISNIEKSKIRKIVIKIKA
jgi:biofilm protein TabA